MSRWANKYVIGLTGNIAVGKSVVRQMLQHLGAYTIDADGLAHQAMAPGAPAYKPVVDTFGQFILNPDKTINRATLANIVFAHPEALAKLEAISHPIINQAINTLITRAKQPVVVIEAIKLLESDLAKAVDAVWVVDAKPPTQVARLVQKRKMSEDDARRRVGAQNPQADKLSKATVVINNDGNVEETWKQVQNVWGEVIKKLAPPMPVAATPAPAAQVAPTAPPRPAPAAATPTAASPAPTSAPVVPRPATTPAPTPTTPVAPTSVTTPAPAAPAPAASAPAVAVAVRRGMPSNADIIAGFISKFKPQPVERMDVMMAFGQKSFLIAQGPGDNIVALMGFQVENLITRVDEFYLERGVPASAVIGPLMVAVEEASRDLQSEVGYVFLPGAIAPDTLQSFRDSGYELTTVNEIKIPAWREAVHEIVSSSINDLKILTKRLREDRVLKPI